MKKGPLGSGPFAAALKHSGAGMPGAIVAEISPAPGVVGLEPLHAVRDRIFRNGGEGNGVGGTRRAVNDRTRRDGVRTGVVVGIIAVIGRGESAADPRPRNKSRPDTAPTPSAAVPPSASPLHGLHA